MDEVERAESLMRVGRVVAGFAGPFGAAAMEALDAVVAPALAKRAQRYLDSIAMRLARLEETVDGFEVGDLSSNEQFHTIFLRAGQASIRTHDPEKLKLLQNAVLNSALDIELDHDLQETLVRYVDELSVLHVCILRFVNEKPDRFPDEASLPNLKMFRRHFLGEYNHVGATREEFEVAIAELKSRSLLHVSDWVSGYESVGKDLKSRSASTQSGPMVRVSRPGQEFLRFLAVPDQEPPGDDSQCLR